MPAPTLDVTVTGTIAPGATGDLVNTATVTVPGGAGFADPDPTNNTATDTDTPGVSRWISRSPRTMARRPTFLERRFATR